MTESARSEHAAPAPVDALPSDAEQAILLAAATCFAERGFAATSVDEVARRMGYTKGRVYHYFRSKTELFIAAASYGLDRLVVEVWPEAECASPPEKRLAAMARAHVLTQIRDLPYHRVMLQGVTMVVRGATTPEERIMQERFVARQRDYEQIFRDVIEEGRSLGVFSNVSLSLQVKTALLALNGACFWFSERDGQTPEEITALADQLVGLTLNGVCGADR